MDEMDYHISISKPYRIYFNKKFYLENKELLFEGKNFIKLYFFNEEKKAIRLEFFNAPLGHNFHRDKFVSRLMIDNKNNRASVNFRYFFRDNFPGNKNIYGKYKIANLSELGILFFMEKLN